MFSAPGLVFGGTEGVSSRLYVLRARTRFRRYRGHRVPFSFFALPDSFSAVTRASGPVFMFFTSGLIFGGTEGIGSRFHVFAPRIILPFRRCRESKGIASHFLVLRAQILFRRYRSREVPFSFFTRPDSFSAVPRVSGHVFMFCAPGLVFGGTEGVRSRFRVLRARTRFRRYHGCRVPF
jgi:hypothetical protein